MIYFLIGAVLGISLVGYFRKNYWTYSRMMKDALWITFLWPPFLYLAWKYRKELANGTNILATRKIRSRSN